jgi:hypothetical protein
MRQFLLPYRKIINWFFLYFFGIPLAVYVIMYIKGEKTAAVIKAILFFIVPAIIAAIGFTPFFKFKSDDKGSSENALLKIPILELYILMIAVVFSFFTIGGIFSICEGSYNTGKDMLIIGLPISTLLLVAINSKRIWFKDQLIPGIVKKQLEVKRADEGAFKYNGNGFIYSGKNKFIACDWCDVCAVMAYKTDNYTYDTIHLILRTDSGEEFDINEDTAGWYIFKNKLADNLIGIDKMWEFKAMLPPFAENMTLIYAKTKA